jgi:hypothetical protein
LKLAVSRVAQVRARCLIPAHSRSAIARGRGRARWGDVGDSRVKVAFRFVEAWWGAQVGLGWSYVPDGALGPAYISSFWSYKTGNNKSDRMASEIRRRVSDPRRFQGVK